MSDVTVVGYLALDDITCPAGRFTDVPGGAAYYCAAATAAAGARVALVARAGNDFPAEALERLESLGVSVDLVVRDEGPSPRSRLVDPSGRDRTSPHHRDPRWWEAQRRLTPPIAPPGAGVFVFNAMPAAALAAQIAVRRAGEILVMDTGTAFLAAEGAAITALIPRVTMFAPSREETRILFPDHDDAVALTELSSRVEIALQKRGPDGLALRRRGGPEVLEPSHVVKIVDTTGAGDSVIGGLAAGLAKSLSDVELLRLASRTAARSIAGVGILGFFQAAP